MMALEGKGGEGRAERNEKLTALSRSLSLSAYDFSSALGVIFEGEAGVVGEGLPPPAHPAFIHMGGRPSRRSRSRAATASTYTE